MSSTRPRSCRATSVKASLTAIVPAARISSVEDFTSSRSARYTPGASPENPREANPAVERPRSSTTASTRRPSRETPPGRSS